PVAELDEGVLVEAEPGDVPRRGGVHERLRAGPEGAPLREPDEGVALLVPVEPALDEVAVELRPDGLGEEVEEEAPRQRARLQPHLALLVLVDHVVLAGRARRARLPERDVDAGDALELEGDVLPDVAEPRPLVLGHAAGEPAGLAVGAA